MSANEPTMSEGTLYDRFVKLIDFSIFGRPIFD